VDGFHSYAWDADGNMLTVDSIGLTYDAFDRMVEQNSGGSYTQLVYGPKGNKLALMNGQTLYRGRVPMPGGVLAIYWSNPLTLVRYWNPNWQGSVPAITSANRTIAGDEAYAPYGEQYAVNGAPSSFTGEWAATEPDLYDFLYREYSNVGRWQSPDPAGLAAVDPSNPQSWNRYAYVLNNPLALVDPLGLERCVPGVPGYEDDCPNLGGGDDGDGGGGWGGWFGGPGGQYAPLVDSPSAPDGTPGSAGGTAKKQTPQQKYQSCMSDFKNSTLGKVVSFGSLVSFLDDFKATAESWMEVALVKGGYVKIMELGGQYAAGPAEVTPVTTVAAPALVYTGAAAVSAATLVDLSMRSTCTSLAYGVPPFTGN
jgi:RHS repeat-associated protein